MMLPAPASPGATIAPDGPATTVEAAIREVLKFKRDYFQNVYHINNLILDP